MATYKLTQQSGQFSGGPHTDFPAYVDLTEIDASMSQADADSIRVYTDAALTNEIPREIVSTTEMHTKIGSFSSGDEIYVDIDGQRSDYATDATYGAENVWGSDYVVVMHFEDNVIDSTGNISPTAINSPTYTTGQIGKGIVGNGSDQYIDLGDIRSLFTGDNAYATALVKLDNATPSTVPQTGLWGINNASGGSRNTHYPYTDGNIYDGTFNTSRPGFSPSGSVTRTDWHKVSVTTEAGSNNWDFWQNTTVIHSQTGLSSVAIDSVSRLLGSLQSTPPDHFLDGMMDEFRTANFTPNSDWITTEYNNQNSPDTFWNVEEVVASVTRNPLFLGGGI